jgi:hypothetical protein
MSSNLTYHARVGSGRHRHEVPLGATLWIGLDRASWILEPRMVYAVQSDRPAQDWGILWIEAPGRWFAQSRCGRVIGSSAFWLDRRPENAGPVIRKGPPWNA